MLPHSICLYLCLCPSFLFSLQYCNEKRPDLAAYLPKSLGYGIGLNLREKYLELSSKNTTEIQPGTILLPVYIVIYFIPNFLPASFCWPSYVPTHIILNLNAMPGTTFYVSLGFCGVPLTDGDKKKGSYKFDSFSMVYEC